MTLQATPYLSFAGHAEEAMTFYQSALGGRLDIMRFKDMPAEGMEGLDPDGVMHSALVIDDATIVMASDGAETDPGAGNVSVTLWGDETAVLQAAFDALAEGGEVTMPFAPSPWGTHFGQLVDRFGVPWMLEGGAVSE